jgi:hypothetical protein
MGKVRTGLAVSLDGFISRPNDGAARGWPGRPPGSCQNDLVVGAEAPLQRLFQLRQVPRSSYTTTSAGPAMVTSPRLDNARLAGWPACWRLRQGLVGVAP